MVPQPPQPAAQAAPPWGEQWERCRAWLVPAMVDSTEAEVVAELGAGRAQLWPGRQAAMVTRLFSADEPYCLIWLAGGDLAELLTFAPGMEAWARAQGAQAARINGRPGWRRVLARRGFAPDGGDLRKVL